MKLKQEAKSIAGTLGIYTWMCFFFSGDFSGDASIYHFTRIANKHN